MSTAPEQPTPEVAESCVPTASASEHAPDASSSSSLHLESHAQEHKPSTRERIRAMQAEDDERAKKLKHHTEIINEEVFDEQPRAILDPSGVPFALGVAALESRYAAMKTGEKELPNPHMHRHQRERERRRARRREPPAKPTPEQTAFGKYRLAYECYDDEYRDEILTYMYKCMDDTQPSRAAMEQQPDIAISMRRALIEFITDLHSAYFLRPETLFLAINIMDRYASKRIIHRRHYQLVGCAALLVAAKYEDSKDNQPLTADLKRYCRAIYDIPAFNQMERHILYTLDWRMGHPTCEAWFRAYTTGIDRTFSENMKKEIERNGWGHIGEIEERGIPMECFDAIANSIARCLMEVMQYQEELIDVTSNVKAEAAVILTKAIYYSRRDRGLETPAGLQVARYMDELLARHPGTIPDNVAQRYGPETAEDAFRRITRWLLGTRIPSHGTFIFLDTIVDHDPKYPDPHTHISAELRDFQRRQFEAYTIKEEEEERARIAAKLEREREEEERAAAEEAERQRHADDAAAQLEILRAKHEAYIRARGEAQYDAHLKERVQLRTSESFDSGYGSVEDGAEREVKREAASAAEREAKCEATCEVKCEAVEDEEKEKESTAVRHSYAYYEREVKCEAVEDEEKENLAVRRSYAYYDESDSEVEAAEVKSEILSPGPFSPEPEVKPTIHT